MRWEGIHREEQRVKREGVREGNRTREESEKRGSTEEKSEMGARG